MRRLPPWAFWTAASKTAWLARQMSGPVPSPSMKGRMGWEGTSRRPSGRAWMRSPGGTEMVEYGGTRGLSVLRPPVEADARIVEGDALLIGLRGIVVLGGVIEERRRRRAEHPVAVCDARRDGEHGGPTLAHVEDLRAAAGRRPLPEVVEHDLRHARGEEPDVPLPLVPVEGLDDARVSDGEGRLLHQPEDGLVVADDLHQETAIVRVHGEQLQDDAVDHAGTCGARLRPAGRGTPSASGGRVVGPSSLLAPVSATRLPARCSDSIVPASVHQPSRISHASSPCARYQLLTSVISSSPRPEGLRERMTSKTRASYM